MSPYNKFLQRVHFHIKILSAAVLFYTLQPLAVVLQSPEATVLKTWQEEKGTTEDEMAGWHH